VQFVDRFRLNVGAIEDGVHSFRGLLSLSLVEIGLDGLCVDLRQAFVFCLRNLARVSPPLRVR
jgi:hypothetical protein